jgi:iron complex outermembrane recepter protein
MFFSDLPIVASVSRLPQRLADAPTAVTVIDREIIKASGARDLNDVFRLVPGFQTYPNTTHTARVTYHGMTDEDYSPRVQVLIDGRSQYSSLYRGGVNWAALPVALEDIERIEVVRGTNVVSYGSNAFLGVINIITVDPALVRGFSSSVSHGNQGVRDYSLRTGGKLGAAGNFRFTYQQRDDNGLTDQYDWKDSYRSRLFDLRADFSLSDRDSLEFSAGQVEAVTLLGRLEKPALLRSKPTDPIRDFRQQSSQLQLLWRHAMSPGSDLQVRYAYVADEAYDRFEAQLSGFLFDVTPFGDRAVRQEIEAQHNFSPFANARLVWGGGWRNDAMNSVAMFPGRPVVHRDTGRVFGNFEWKPSPFFTANLGLASEHDSLAGNHTSPRLSGSFHLTPENTVRLGFSRAYRTASLPEYSAYQLFLPYAKVNGPVSPAELAFLSQSPDLFLFVGSPGLPAERMDSWELGYLGDWRDWRMSFDARLFQEKIPNRLSLVFLDPKYLIEALNVRIEGIEYQWKWQPFEATRLMFGQSFIHVSSDLLDSALATRRGVSPGADPLHNLEELTERSVPDHSTSLMVMQKLPLGLDFSLAAYWVGKTKWSRNTWADKYDRVDARLGYPFHLAGQRGEIAYTAQSLNGAHGEFSAYGEPHDRIVERRHWLSLRLDL